jgi:hypothetical protein
MRTIKFTEDREFDYGEGLVVHKAGDEATLRDDKAQRWVTRGVAHFIDEQKLAQVIPPAEEELQTLVASAVADNQAAFVAEVNKDDNAVESPTNVEGDDSGGDGERAVDVAPVGGSAAAPAAPAKPKGGRNKRHLPPRAVG